MKKIKYLLTIIGIILFLYILLNVNVPYLLKILSNIDTYFLTIALIIYFVCLFFKILKWKWITNIIAPQFSFFSASVSYLTGFAFSTVTPAKMGDILRIFYVKQEGVEYGDALSALVMDRIIDILMLFIIGITALISFSQFYGIQIIPIEVVASVLLIIILFVLMISSRKSLRLLLIPVYNLLIPEKWKNCALEQFSHYFNGINRLISSPGKMSKAIGSGLVSWILPFFYSYFLALSIGVELPFIFFVVVIPIIAVIELLPLSVSGIGTRDLALIFFFGLYNIPAEAAVAFSILYLFICFWMLGIIGVVVWLRYPADIDY
ncbi:lysylphosphatidylglycerol synthase transmembrane domain-containing protein [Methanoplanus endosymbiosus]|uniref:Flippase-like domain-containing protein n=1 Tax=Methanoplanus endosymbiosus TaxID=33865 RepID=A0A9E7PPP5_9EURY|nr:lysylphosphatidylglycerol synthase transmembrane domain-containing protein [Methanoplanus endosymbiosus]UUX91327.1 flippase-like domain-containing protein [Methanoplanus endosymbiosus]